MIKDALSTLLPVYPELLKLEGWSVFKFSNLDSNGQPGKNTLWVDTRFFDVPLGRYLPDVCGSRSTWWRRLK